MYRMAVIDDEYIVVEGIKAILSRQNFEVEIVGAAYDGISGLEMLRDTKPDIVISDIRIPGLDGLSLVEEAREFLPDSQFIMVSGYTEFEYARRALTLGVRAYIDKPITIEKISSALTDAIEQLSVLRAGKKQEEQEMQQQIARQEFNQALSRMIHAVNHNNSNDLTGTAHQAIQALNHQNLDVLEYCQESFKLLCVIEGVYLEHQKQQAREIIVSYADLEKICSSQDMDNYTLKIIDNIAGKLKATKCCSSNRTIRQLLEYIEKNYHRDIGLNELADQTGMNPAYLSMLFKDEVGMSYIKYLTSLRIDKAKELLIAGYKVNEVSEMIGYSNYRYFTNKFKQLTGCTPGEYREGACGQCK